MNHGFLSLIDLRLNIQRGIQPLRGLPNGLAALMIVGLTLVAAGLAPLVWYFDMSATLDYADPLIAQLIPSLPTPALASASFMVLTVTLLPTVVELLLPSIGERVPAAALLVFGFSVVDAVTDWPRVVATMAVYRGGFLRWGFWGDVLWAILHPVLLLFATFLFELLFVLCVVLILFLVMQIAQKEASWKAAA